MDTEGKAERADELEDTGEEAVDDLENGVDGVVNLLEELSLYVSRVLK